MEIKGQTFNDYHKQYYINKIKGCKIECDCGLLVDKFRFCRHNKTKKHLKLIIEKNEKININ